MVAATNFSDKCFDTIATTRLDIISCLGLFLINLKMLLAKDIRGKRLLDIVNALVRKIRLFRS